MKSKLLALLISSAMLLTVLSGCSTTETTSSGSDTGITELKFATLSSAIELDAGKTETGYFKVKGNGDFSIEDIEFVSSDNTVATFTYDKTALKTCIYYTITAISSGEVEIYAQTKDGKVSTDKIPVKVSGYLYDIAELDDNSLPNAKRHSIRATIDASLVEGRSEDYIRGIMEYIVLKHSEAHKLNSIHLLLYIEGDDTSGVATVGHCTYAPYGDLNRASEVQAGDYSTFEFCDFTINSPSERDTYRGK